MPSRHRLQLGAETRTLVVDKQGERLLVTLDEDEPVEVDATTSGVPGALSLLIDGEPHSAYVALDGEVLQVTVDGRTFVIAPARAGGRGRGSVAGYEDPEGQMTAPLAGVVVDVRVAVGDTVEVGQAVCVVEAMKMQNEVHSPHEGTITAVHCERGQRVERGELLIEYQSAE
jgi:biotin carboxyl carrier protein